MKSRLHLELDQAVNSDLARVIEPLANYICAADRPKTTLHSALAVLFDEVKETNRSTLLHIASVRADSLGLAS